MIRIINLEFYNRLVPYLAYFFVVIVASFFADWRLVVPLAGFVLVRINQLMNQREQNEGYLSFLYHLPIDRPSLYGGKLVTLLLVLTTTTGLSWLGNRLSLALLIQDLYMEGMVEAGLDFAYWSLGSLALLTNIFLLRMYLVLGVKHMLLVTRALAMGLLLVLGLLYTTVIGSYSPEAQMIVEHYTHLPVVFWLITVVTSGGLILYTGTEFQRVDLMEP